MKKKRKWLADLLAAVMVLTMTPMAVFAAEDDGTIFISDGIRYRITDSGANTVEVIHSSQDEVAVNPPDVTYGGDIEIPQTVTYNNIEYSVTGIAAFAFVGAEIESISLPEGLLYIDAAAFYSSTLTSISIPASVERLGNENNAVNPVFPESLENVAFAEGSNLKIVGCGAFKGCAINEIILPDKVETIYSSAFSLCENLKSISLPDSVNDIGYGAFSGCDSLESINIPANADINAIDMEYTGGEKHLGALAGWSNVKNTTFSDGSKYEITDGVLYEDNILLAAVDENISSVDVKAETIEIVSNAFANCTSLASISLPDGLEVIGDNAFNYATNLGVSIPGLTLPNSEPVDALSFINIPSSVTEIGDNFLKGGIKDDGTSILVMQSTELPQFGDGMFAGIGENGIVIYYPANARNEYTDENSPLKEYLPSDETGEETAQQGYALTLKDESVNVCPGKGATLVLDEYEAVGSNMTLVFSSDNENALTVDNDGKVTGKAKGTAVVTAEITMNGITLISDTCTVTVGHNFENGKCTLCGEEDPDYIPPVDPTDPTQPGAGEGDNQGGQNNDNQTATTDKSAQTGDDSNIALWAGLLVLAAAVATGTVVYGRKRREQ